MKKIEITEEEFAKLVAKVVAEETKEKDIPAMLGMAFLLFGGMLGKKMFHEEEEGK